MCGISGLMSSTDKINVEDLNIMVQALNHRGPDDNGIYYEGQIGLGHNRLSIIDLSYLGHQPMFDVNKDCCIVYNGEIYNYQGIRNELLSRGYSFRSKTDTEVIIYAYYEFGFDCLKKLRGMFAFALWDSKKKILFLACDRLGKKPVYYYSDGKQFVFASEIKALLKLYWVPRELDPLAINEYFTFQYILSPKTIFRYIFKLPAAHFLIVEDSGATYKIQRYWQPDQDDYGATEEMEDPSCEANRLLEESVILRLISDVEVGVLLSGGIDSSLIAAIASQNSSRKIRTFSVGFKDMRFNELPHANLVAKKLGTEHYAIIADEVTPDIFIKVMEHIDQPLGDAACIPTYLIARCAARHVKVVLTGEGADEIFGGYPYYIAEQYIGPLYFIPADVRKYLSCFLGKFISFQSSIFLQRIVKVLETRREASISRWVSIFGRHDKIKYFSDSFLSSVKEKDPMNSIYEIFVQSKKEDLLSRGLEVDLQTWLPDDLLMKVDKMTMANSLEARAPFLDHKLVEFMYSLDAKYKVVGGGTKILLKKIAEKYLPFEIINRKKHGFEVPVGQWMLDKLRDLAEESFSSKVLRTVNIFNANAVHTEWAHLKSAGRAWYPRRIWLMFCFLQWCQQYKCNF